jgi:hypothetical protein
MFQDYNGANCQQNGLISLKHTKFKSHFFPFKKLDSKIHVENIVGKNEKCKRYVFETLGRLLGYGMRGNVDHSYP